MTNRSARHRLCPQADDRRATCGQELAGEGQPHGGGAAQQRDAGAGHKECACDSSAELGQHQGQADAVVLSDRDGRILAFERKWWRFSGAKEQAIFAEFGVSATRYYQVLNQLLDAPEAMAYDPVLVLRLRRLRGGFVAGVA